MPPIRNDRDEEERQERAQQKKEWQAHLDHLRRERNRMSIADQVGLFRELGGSIVSRQPGEPQVNHTANPDTSIYAADLEKQLVAMGTGARDFPEDVRDAIRNALDAAIYHKLLNLSRFSPDDPPAAAHPSVMIDPDARTVHWDTHHCRVKSCCRP